MDGSARTLAQIIGTRVRQERTVHQWTLDRLAAAAGVSRRMVINVEQGAVNPSIGTLLRLATALGVGLPALVEPPSPASAQITRAGDGAELWTGRGGGRGVLVTATGPPNVVELWDWNLAPGDAHISDAHSVGTRELLQVLEGSVTVEVDGKAHVLDPGDALTFHGDVPHTYANPAPLSARFSLCVYEPELGPNQENRRQ